MWYRILADAVIIIHLLFIVFVMTGGFLALYRPAAAVLHLPAACWGAYVEFSGTVCPLTPMENHLSRMAGGAGYSSGFIEHYLVPIVYPAALTQEIQILLGGLVVAGNLMPYSWLLYRYFRDRKEGRM